MKFIDYSFALFTNKDVKLEVLTQNFAEFNNLGFLPSTIQMTNINTASIENFPQLVSVDKKWEVNFIDKRIDINFIPRFDLKNSDDLISEFKAHSYNLIDLIFRLTNIKVNRLAFNSKLIIEKYTENDAYMIKLTKNSGSVDEWNYRMVDVLEYSKESINNIVMINSGKNVNLVVGNFNNTLEATLFHFDINTRQTNTDYRFNNDSYKLILDYLIEVRTENLGAIYDTQ